MESTGQQPPSGREPQSAEGKLKKRLLQLARDWVGPFAQRPGVELLVQLNISGGDGCVLARTIPCVVNTDGVLERTDQEDT